MGLYEESEVLGLEFFVRIGKPILPVDGEICLGCAEFWRGGSSCAWSRVMSIKISP